MARQTKPGIPYFSHDSDMLQDKKIKLIKAKHGLIGYAVFLRLLEELYRSEGYYLKIDEDFNILFSDDNNIDYNVYILILNECIEKELFNKKLYKKHSILTSQRIQSNYCTATDRRKEVHFIKEYLLIDIKNVYNEKVNVYINSLNVDTGTQSKVKGKEKKSKELYGDFVLLTKEEHDKLIDKYGTSLTADFITNLDNYIGSKGKDYKSHYHTILSWERKNNSEQGNKPKLNVVQMEHTGSVKTW